jgi:acetoin utilization deacetylase AcuC-like enzyme
MATRTGVVVDPACLAHDMGRHHPETPKRLQVLLEMMMTGDVRDLGLRMLDGRRALPAEVIAVHTPEHYRRIMATQGRTVALVLDTTAGPRSFDAAMHAAGAGLALADAVVSGEVSNGFALVRPPGHHAEAHRAGGFCLFNNAAIAAKYARDVLKMDRVAIVDFDLHHGNGTQSIFYRDPSVLVISTHQAPGYPGSGGVEEEGEGPGAGYNVNIPLAPGHGDPEFDAIYGGLVVRILERFKPQMIVVSAGFDIFAGDVLGRMEVTAQGFSRIASHLRAAADRLCGGRLIMILEGGYSIAGLRDGVLACLGAMASARKVTAPKGFLEDLPMGDALRYLPAYRKRFDV